MEAITKYGSYFQSLVHFRTQNSGSVILARYLTFSKSRLPKKLVVTRARPSINDHEAANRPLIQFPPSLLDDRFRSVSVDHSVCTRYGPLISYHGTKLFESFVQNVY